MRSIDPLLLLIVGLLVALAIYLYNRHWLAMHDHRPIIHGIWSSTEWAELQHDTWNLGVPEE